MKFLLLFSSGILVLLGAACDKVALTFRMSAEEEPRQLHTALQALACSENNLPVLIN